MSGVAGSFFFATLGLQLVLILSGILAGTRRAFAQQQLKACRPLLAAAIGSHVVHLIEEAVTGFHIRFPALMGLDAWPLELFVGFNLTWVAVWLLCAFWLRPNRITGTALWFLGLASALNAVAHPGLAIAVGGYFPGLLTSPVVGVFGVLLIFRLDRASRR